MNMRQAYGIDVERTTLNLFQEMGLPEKLVARVAALGITEPTPIQTHAIPPVLDGKDVMGLAQTGTGKTAAFGLPLVSKLLATGKKPAPKTCLLYTSPSPRDGLLSRMPSSA